MKLSKTIMTHSKCIPTKCVRYGDRLCITLQLGLQIRYSRPIMMVSKWDYFQECRCDTQFSSAALSFKLSQHTSLMLILNHSYSHSWTEIHIVALAPVEHAQLILVRQLICKICDNRIFTTTTPWPLAFDLKDILSLISFQT